jgi:putative thioredoxin
LTTPMHRLPGGQMSGTVTFGDSPKPVGGTAGGAGDLISDTTTAGFTADVIKASQDVTVLVDFWAPWCGPCKQLTPIIEKVVREANGRVKLVKLNIDDHPAIPGQMGIQSIPAVVAFSGGKPVDGFMGALPESQIREFIDKVAGPPAKSSAEEQVEQIIAQSREAFTSGDVETAARGFGAILQMDQSHVGAIAGMAGCMLAAASLTGPKSCSMRSRPKSARIRKSHLFSSAWKWRARLPNWAIRSSWNHALRPIPTTMRQG